MSIEESSIGEDWTRRLVADWREIQEQVIAASEGETSANANAIVAGLILLAFWLRPE
jgi:hypothetical protein